MTNSFIIAAIGFVLITLVYVSLLIRELWAGIGASNWDLTRKQSVKRTILILLIGWTLFVTIWSASGVMADFTKFPFNFLPVVAVPLITMIAVTFGATFKEILARIPEEKVVRLQTFRFFVELMLWVLFIGGLLPEQMTFEGRNFDILVGLTSPVIAYLLAKKRMSKAALIAWNIACLGLLTNIVTIAILSTPSPIRVFMNEPANTIVTQFPISWLPGLLVPLAYTLNLFSIRQAMLKNPQATGIETV